jgi:hypothetical protein
MIQHQGHPFTGHIGKPVYLLHILIHSVYYYSNISLNRFQYSAAKYGRKKNTVLQKKTWWISVSH